MAVPDPSLATLLERSARLRARSGELLGQTVAQGRWCATLRARVAEQERVALDHFRVCVVVDLYAPSLRIAAMPDMLDLTARCDALHKQTTETRHKAAVLREQATTMRMILAEQCVDLARLRKQITKRRRSAEG